MMSINMNRPACGSCGGMKVGAARRAAAELIPEPQTNDRGMYPFIGEPYDCEAYHGAYRATTVFLVGYGTEHEKLFARTLKKDAEKYAAKHNLSAAHINVSSLCHDRVIEMLGA